MALFSRRCLQRLIDENADFLSPEQLEEHMRRLNHVREEYLSTEWEIAILNCFSKLGNIKHEPKEYGGSRLLDLVFDSPAIQFGADIATRRSARFVDPSSRQAERLFSTLNSSASCTRSQPNR